MAPLDWHVAADDRTGALEVAAEVAAGWGRPVSVTVYPQMAPRSVIDLGSRRCTPDESAFRIRVLNHSAVLWKAYKFDSTLRGNWVTDLRAHHEMTARRVLVLAAWPEMGRTCVDGVVHVHGMPIGDLREHAPEVEVLHTAAELQRWLDDSGSNWLAACDIADTAAMHEAAAVAARYEQVTVGGPAGPIGAVFAVMEGGRATNRRRALRLPALVVCGSATAIAARQVDELRRRRPDIEVLAAPAHGGGDLDPDIARELAREGRQRLWDGGHRTVVLIGGDTAAAFLGDGTRSVGGTVLPGLPWSVGDETGVVMVTKAGAFGDDDTLVRLFDEGATT